MMELKKQLEKAKTRRDETLGRLAQQEKMQKREVETMYQVSAA